MTASEDRLREMTKMMEQQYSDDQLVEVAPDGTLRPVGTTPGQSIVLRDPRGEYGADRIAA